MAYQCAGAIKDVGPILLATGRHCASVAKVASDNLRGGCDKPNPTLNWLDQGLVPEAGCSVPLGECNLQAIKEMGNLQLTLVEVESYTTPVFEVLADTIDVAPGMPVIWVGGHPTCT
jgi:hypothetical protein